MNVLVIDHYFAQDIEAFLNADQHRFWVLPYSYFSRSAQEIFPEPVFVGLEAYYRPEYSEARAQYADLIRVRLHQLYMMFPFDVVLAPSDTFFWIRAVILAAQELDIPFVVLQKEATIPTGWMDGPAKEWGLLSPFIADQMLVSSEHHKEFWINSGTDPRKITVTGQPRFDFYRQPSLWKTWEDMGLKLGENRRNILFLTYDVHAYLPYIVRDGMTPWEQLRSESENALLSLANQENFNLLLKAHPQPAEDQSHHLKELAANPHVFLLDPKGDTRQFIVNADVVVGFQTTAMFEAVAARKPTIYTFWTEPVVKLAGDLIPFHDAHPAIHIARSPEELCKLVRKTAGLSPSPTEVHVGEEFFEKYLGPIDGHSTERCIKMLEKFNAESRFRRNGNVTLRSLRARAPVFCMYKLVILQFLSVITRMLLLLLHLEYPIARRLRHLVHLPVATSAGARIIIVARRNFVLERIRNCRAVLARRENP
ncbi:CDP-glycerol glycerophosphotransferase family protein [Candidatus Bathyarchaeota archaeon]|jgi:hypothetical protein|nr:CDP-glycerol glycerophosphotransferase family protein [Candidatus Bathyarchaeota archaeon]